MSVAGSGGVPEEPNDTLKLHTVTDCNSLHECIAKQGLPEDKRAAIEVLSIREMLSREDDGSGSELEDDDDRLSEGERLKRDLYQTLTHIAQGGASMTNAPA